MRVDIKKIQHLEIELDIGEGKVFITQQIIEKIDKELSKVYNHMISASSQPAGWMGHEWSGLPLIYRHFGGDSNMIGAYVNHNDYINLIKKWFK